MTESTHMRLASQTQWPLWIKIYAVLLGGPMVGVCAGLAVWIFSSQFGGLLDDADQTATLLLMIASAMLLGLGAYLFFSGVWGVVNNRSDAILMAATGHLIVAGPAITLLSVDFFRNQERFVNDLVSATANGFAGTEFRLLAWVIFNIYLALILSLADQ